MALVQQFDHDSVLTLGTLGANVAILANTKIDNTRSQGFRIVKSNFWFDVRGKTTDEGPIQVGVACNMSAANVEATVEDDPQISTDDISRSMKQFVKPLFQIGKDELKIPIATDGDNRSWIPIVVSYGKNGWSIPESQNLGIWAYNMDGTALTTGTTIAWFAEHFGVWLRD